MNLWQREGVTAAGKAGYGFALNKQRRNIRRSSTQGQAWMGVVGTRSQWLTKLNDVNNIQKFRLVSAPLSYQEKYGPHADDFEPFVETNWIP